MNTVMQDLRYAVRGLAKSPGFTAVAVATLALGIGANTAIFSVVHAVLLRRLPYPESDRLVVMRETQIRRNGSMGVAWPTFLDWRAQSRSFRGLAGFRLYHAMLSGAGEPEMLRSAEVSAEFFPLLGARPSAGRFFGPADDRPGAPPTAVLSYGQWKRRFGGDPSAVGRLVDLDAVPHLIVGVLPPTFGFFPEPVDVYTPLGLMGSRPDWLNRGNHSGVRVLGRLAPDSSLAAARREMETIMLRLEKQYPDSNSGQRAVVESLDDVLFRDYRAALWILLAAVGVVLLIACANVAHLLLARASARRREFAIRTAIGASRGRLVRQLVTESLLLSAIGGALGVALAAWALGPLLALSPSEIPRLADTRIDPAVLLFTLGASIATGMLFGLAPAAQASRTNPQGTLRESGNAATVGRDRQRLRGALFVSEVALAFVLAVAAGLLLRSLKRVEGVSPGMETDGVLALDVYLPETKYPTPAERRLFFERVLDELRRLPGVESASASLCTPVVGQCWGSVYLVAGRPVPSQADLPNSDFDMVESSFFRTMRVPLRAGRFFDATDTPDSPPVVVINETMARKWWPRESPIGKRIKQGFPQNKSPYREIVGVVGDVPQRGLDEAIHTEVFLPDVAGPRSRDDAARAHEPAAHEPREAGHRGRPRDRQGPGPDGGAADEPVPHRVARATALSHAPARRLRRARAAPRVGRDLRRRLLRGRAAPPGDRHPDGSRRGAGRRPAPGLPAGPSARRRRHGDRRRGRARTDPVPVEPSLRRRADGSHDLRRRLRRRRRGRRARLRAAGAARHGGRSRDGPAGGVDEMINLTNLEKSLANKAGETFLLRRIQFTVAPGEFVTIMGPSGAGKSTLLEHPRHARPRLARRIPLPRATPCNA